MYFVVGVYSLVGATRKHTRLTQQTRLKNIAKAFVLRCKSVHVMICYSNGQP